MCLTMAPFTDCNLSSQTDRKRPGSEFKRRDLIPSVSTRWNNLFTQSIFSASFRLMRWSKTYQPLNIDSLCPFCSVSRVCVCMCECGVYTTFLESLLFISCLASCSSASFFSAHRRATETFHILWHKKLLFITAKMWLAKFRWNTKAEDWMIRVVKHSHWWCLHRCRICTEYECAVAAREWWHETLVNSFTSSGPIRDLNRSHAGFTAQKPLSSLLFPIIATTVWNLFLLSVILNKWRVWQ